MALMDRFRIWLARGLVKAAGSMTIPEWIQYNFVTPTFQRLCAEGYRANTVVFACISEIAFALPEPQLRVWETSDSGSKVIVPKHLANPLLAHPHDQLSMADMLAMTGVYLGISGNCYWHKQRSKGKRVVRLVPLNDAQIQTIPGGDKLVSHYEWLKDGLTPEQKIIPVEDIIHFKWLPDPLAPWTGMAPLVAAAREVDTDNEATRYLFTLLKNDAIPRVAITVPPEGVVDVDRIREQWYDRHGGDKRGGVVVLEDGAKAERLSLDLQELAFEALRYVPEARICAAYRVPAMLAGVNVGLARSTFSNMAEARKYFTESMMVRLWTNIAGQLTTSLLPEFSNRPGETIGFDLSTVTALAENQQAKRTWVHNGVLGGYIKVNEGRGFLGLPPDPGQDIYLRGMNVLPTAKYRVIDARARVKALPKPEATELERERAIRKWDKDMPDYAELLDAEDVREQ